MENNMDINLLDEALSLSKDVERLNGANTNTPNPDTASNASNYKDALSYEINTRTGALQVKIVPPPLSGFFGKAITPAIFYLGRTQASDRSMLGLPLAWSYNFSFISKSRVFINGQGSYYIDPDYDSGMRYYKLKNMEFKSFKETEFPYDKKLKYINVLRSKNGDNQYFDTNGRLIGMDDRFKNHVLFYYDRDGDVYHSKLTKIIDAYGQEITFNYSDNEIKISYPKGGNNHLQFSYLIDENQYLVGYKDPIGQTTLISNEGGIVKSDLISSISYPNGLQVAYDYTTINYYKSLNKTDRSRLDVVSSIAREYQDTTRKILYNYNPEDGPGYNFTGYPKYSVDSTEDNLLQSAQDYRYITQVDDGILLTRHYYNHLHLELETKVFTKDDLNNPIKHIINTFQSEDKDGYFPYYTQLPANYQTPTSVTSYTFNDQGDKLIHKVETDFSDYGLPMEVRTYKTITHDGDFILIDKVQTTYYDDNYGLIEQRCHYDYTDAENPANPIIRKVVNGLTVDKRNIATTIEGFLLYENGTYIFKHNKKTTHNHDEQGRVIFSKLEWVDGQPHTLTSTQSATNYELSIPVLTVTHTNAQGQSSIVKIDTTTGWTISKINALGYSINYTYDNLGRKLTTKDPLGVVTSFIYDNTNNKVTTKHANGYETYVYYNGFGELVKHADNIGGNATERVLENKSYNDKGQLVIKEGILGSHSRIDYTYNNKGQVFTKTDALGNVKRYEYDPIAQTKTKYYNDIKVTEVSQDNNIVTQVAYASSSPAINVKSVKYYNSYSKVSKAILGDQALSQESLETEFLYDADLKVSSCHLTGSDGLKKTNTNKRDLFANPISASIEVGYPEGNRTTHAKSDTYTYNNLNQLIEEKTNLGQSYKYTYNAVGLKSSYTDYSGTVFNYDYYANNQLKSVTYQDKNGKKHEKNYTYYSLTHQLQSLEEFCDGISQERMEYTYNLEGKIESIIYPDGKQVVYQYDHSRAVLTQFTDAIGQVTTYTYDDYGRLVSQQIAGTDYSVSVAYYSKNDNPANSGKIASIQISNGVLNSYQYDDFSAISKVTITDTTIHSPSNVILSIECSYDLVTRNILSIRYHSSAFPQEQDYNYQVAYTYNSINQLITEKVTNPLNKLITSTSYTYDAANNITKEDIVDATGKLSSIVYSYDADNKLITVTSPSGTRNLKYDINGNLIEDGLGCSLVYDERNRLVAYKDTKNSVQAAYNYYPNGLRASKKVNNSELIQFYYDHAKYANIVNEIQGVRSSSYLTLGNKRYIRLVQDSKVVAQYLIINLKDTIGVVNSSNKLDKSYNYEPYGKSRKLQAAPIAPSTLSDISNNPFGYTNEYLDAESGLIYLRSRYYNPAIKRFISRDKTMLINRYSYADGNPVMFIDPSGEKSSWAIASITVGVIASLLAVAVGAGIIAYTGGLAIPAFVGFVAGGVIGAGLTSASYGATHTNDKNFNQAEFWASVGIGAGFGALTGFVTPGLSFVSDTLEEALSYSALFHAGKFIFLDLGLNTGVGALAGYVSNGPFHKWQGKEAAEAAGFGAVFGLISGVFAGALRLVGNVTELQAKIKNFRTSSSLRAVHLTSEEGISGVNPLWKDIELGEISGNDSKISGSGEEGSGSGNDSKISGSREDGTGYNPEVPGSPDLNLWLEKNGF